MGDTIATCRHGTPHWSKCVECTMTADVDQSARIAELEAKNAELRERLTMVEQANRDANALIAAEADARARDILAIETDRDEWKREAVDRGFQRERAEFDAADLRDNLRKCNVKANGYRGAAVVAEAERDAALAQVGVLREAFMQTLRDMGVLTIAVGSPLHTALTDTAASSQARDERIRAEAIAPFADLVSLVRSEVLPHMERNDSLDGLPNWSTLTQKVRAAVRAVLEGGKA